MSWNNQGGGPGRSPGRGPWGQGPSGPPTGHLEEIIRRLQGALGKLTPGGKGGGAGGVGAGGGLSSRSILFLILAAILVWFAWGTFYTVQPNEVGINLVFGRYTGKTAAGLNTNNPHRAEAAENFCAAPVRLAEALAVASSRGLDAGAFATASSTRLVESEVAG